MNNHFTKMNLYRWMLALTVPGFLAFALAGGGGFQERFTPLAAVDDETDWTLAHAIEVEKEEMDWTLAKNEGKEDETDWTLAKINEEEEPDWTLASNDRIYEEEVDWTLA